MEITPQRIPRVRGASGYERVYEAHITFRRVHPLVGALLAVAAIVVFALLFVFVFWLGLVALGLGAVALALRLLFGGLTPRYTRGQDPGRAGPGDDGLAPG